MIKVPAAEFQRNVGRYQDLALTQPVAVTRNGRERRMRPRRSTRSWSASRVLKKLAQSRSLPVFTRDLRLLRQFSTVSAVPQSR
jgi:hypothetical protein